MNAHDRYMTDAPTGFDAEAQESAEIEARAAILDAIKTDDGEATCLFEEMDSQLYTERAQITRLVYAKDGAGLIALLTPLFAAAANRTAEYRVIAAH